LRDVILETLGEAGSVPSATVEINRNDSHQLIVQPNNHSLSPNAEFNQLIEQPNIEQNHNQLDQAPEQHESQVSTSQSTYLPNQSQSQSQRSVSENPQSERESESDSEEEAGPGDKRRRTTENHDRIKKRFLYVVWCYHLPYCKLGFTSDETKIKERYGTYYGNFSALWSVKPRLPSLTHV
jgi:hypothetical protein